MPASVPHSSWQRGLFPLFLSEEPPPTHFCHATLLKFFLSFSPQKMLYFAFILRVKNSGFTGFPSSSSAFKQTILLLPLVCTASLRSTECVFPLWLFLGISVSQELSLCPQDG